MTWLIVITKELLKEIYFNYGLSDLSAFIYAVQIFVMQLTTSFNLRNDFQGPIAKDWDKFDFCQKLQQNIN